MEAASDIMMNKTFKPLYLQKPENVFVEKNY